MVERRRSKREGEGIKEEGVEEKKGDRKEWP